MALSELRMHHLRTGALPPRTAEEHAYMASQENPEERTVLEVPMRTGDPIEGPQPPDDLPPPEPLHLRGTRRRK